MRAIAIMASMLVLSACNGSPTPKQESASASDYSAERVAFRDMASELFHHPSACPFEGPEQLADQFRETAALRNEVAEYIRSLPALRADAEQMETEARIAAENLMETDCAMWEPDYTAEMVEGWRETLAEQRARYERIRVAARELAEKIER